VPRTHPSSPPAPLSALEALVAAAVIALGPATTLGMARFAYGLALPAMKEDLGLTYAQAGWLNTANAVGYLIGALPAARVIARLGARRTLVAGMALTAIAIVGSGLTRSFELISLLRLVAGVTGALTFVAGGSIASQIAARAATRPTLVIGVYMGGVGLGILMSGLFVPAMVAHPHRIASLEPWQQAWLAVGIVSLLLAGLVQARAPAQAAATAQASEGRATPWPVSRYLPTLVAYLLYGMAYIGYMTFIVAYIRSQGFGVTAVSAFWTLLGAGAIACSWIWAKAIERLPGGRANALLLAVLLVANALPLASAHPAVTIASALLFGLSFTGVVASVIGIFRRNLLPAHMPSAIAIMTAAFAAGQIAGPVVSGLLADLFGGLAWSLGFSVATLALAIAVALLQRDRGDRGDQGARGRRDEPNRRGERGDRAQASRL
jgi:predicted MFS family arabinose efflux permease